MKPDPNYPRMMFHRSKDPVTVYSEEAEAALGREWSRKVLAALPKEDKPPRLPDPEPEPEPEEEPEEEREPEEVYAHPADAAPPAKPHRAKPAVHKPPHKKTAHKRG